MGFLMDIWNGLRNGLEQVLRFYEGLLEPIFGVGAWGVAIILLTVTVRIFMIPLMVRQVKSMRAMQAVQPEMKKIQEKYKADRSMMKTDPDRYKKLKEKQREEQMALYQEHGVNPVGGCLPLVMQMPVFLALFQVLQGPSLAPDLADAPFLGLASLSDTASNVVSGGETGFAFGAALTVLGLIVLQVGTTYYSQKQMMSRNTSAAAEQLQAQKIMLYVMPFFLGFLSYTFPIGVVLYWVTTNVWTIGQQFFIFRSVEKQEAAAAEKRDEERKNKAQRKHVGDVTDPGAAKGKGSAAGGKTSPGGPAGKKGSGAKGSKASTGKSASGGQDAGDGDGQGQDAPSDRPRSSRPNRGKGSGGGGGPTANGSADSNGKREHTTNGNAGTSRRSSGRAGPNGMAPGAGTGSTRRSRRSNPGPSR